MDVDQVDAGSTEASSTATVAQELRAALGIDTLEDVRLESLTSYPLTDKLRWTNERRGAQICLEVTLNFTCIMIPDTTSLLLPFFLFVRNSSNCSLSWLSADVALCGANATILGTHAQLSASDVEDFIQKATCRDG